MLFSSKEKLNNKDNGNVIINAKDIGKQNVMIENNGNKNGKGCLIF